ncbi:MAG: SDR family NAD(P)-dependent oxidoreductase [Pseudomonadota bacterium]|jgi:NAD(P)-dependent dehydrogenase (short-subunit alcohol dehydrogenase family)|nr:SDR family NAD(P)-dependent oxidoreductase [Pseudomonadota bacterium]MEC8821470.1 SDR family NAD(P)-dependent oxidoreductase [Pseudomonadota bacterium]
MLLKDKVAFITGAASGLGRATAENFIAAGANVMIFDLNEENAEKAASELGDNATFAAGDVANADAVSAAIDKTLSQYGALHININSAGIGAASRTLGRDGPMDLKMFEFVIRVNLVGTFNCLRLCANAMQSNEPVTEDGERGVIVNVASVAAFDGQIGQAAYSASKAGVAGMTLPIARDLSRSGIRIATIAPGIFETPMMKFAPPQVRQPLVDMTQFPKRLGNPSEFAQTAAYIVECGYINGEVIRLDSSIRMAPK